MQHIFQNLKLFSADNYQWRVKIFNIDSGNFELWAFLMTKLLVSLGFIAAFIKIGISVFQIVASAGDEKPIAEAKKELSRTLVSVIFLILAQVILFSINPDLVS